MPLSEEGLFIVANVTISWMHPRDPRGILISYSLTFITYDGSLLIEYINVDASITSYIFTDVELGMVQSNFGKLLVK